MNPLIEFAKTFEDSKKEAIKSINTCYHPNCNDKSINSHILQKNGILSSIATDGHLWELEINQFKNPRIGFKRTGINKIYSFNCFCNNHDRELFEKIETKVIDFDDYESCLLFTLRTIYNEMFRKQVNLKVYEKLVAKIGLNDIKKIEEVIWRDINDGTETFIFENRAIKKIELCVSSFYNYDSSRELQEYILKYKKDMDRISSVFINCFPYEDNSILLMGYNKVDEKKLKGYFYTFFRENEKRVFRRLTNLILFQCETFAVSEKFYLEKLKGIENVYLDAIDFMMLNQDERKVYDLNFFDENFANKFHAWLKRMIN